MNVMTALSASATVPAQPGPARFTTPEFLRMVDGGVLDDIAVELVQGEMHRMPPPSNPHRLVQSAVLARLFRTVAESLVCAEAGLDLGNDTIVGCDAAVLRAPFANPGMIPAGAVALVIEIAVSTADRDLGLKRRLYAAAGIPTYWVIDAERSVIHVFDRPEEGDYRGLALVRFGEPLAVPGSDGTVGTIVLD